MKTVFEILMILGLGPLIWFTIRSGALGSLTHPPKPRPEPEWQHSMCGFPADGTMHVYDASTCPEQKIGEFPIHNGRVQISVPVSRSLLSASFTRKAESDEKKDQHT